MVWFLQPEKSGNLDDDESEDKEEKEHDSCVIRQYIFERGDKRMEIEVEIETRFFGIYNFFLFFFADLSNSRFLDFKLSRI